jgi:hypothetical protein
MMTTKGKPISLTVHPILTKELLKLEFRKSVEPDYDLPKGDFTSPAVRPPVPVLVLENRQGYPQRIRILASGGDPAVGVTVEDVLKQIHEVLRKPSTKSLWSQLCNKRQKAITDSFRKRYKTEGERSKGLYAHDYLCGKNRLQILLEQASDRVPPSTTSSPCVYMVPSFAAVPAHPILKDELGAAGTFIGRFLTTIGAGR